jgi:hypothetical protein
MVLERDAAMVNLTGWGEQGSKDLGFSGCGASVENSI